jgi:DNA (cytosine-5)-methyltransferase 1
VCTFSTYTLKADKKKDQRWQLLESFSKIINEVQPDVISMENVPRLMKFKQAPVFDKFVKNLKKNKYHIWFDIVYCPDYGIAQKRKRLVLLASKHGKIELIQPTHKPENYVTVKDVIGDLDQIEAGETSENDFFHRASLLSELNLRRIRSSIPGGSWKNDWEDELVLDCHKEKGGKSYGSVYGRMKWDEPSPTMTTFCTGIGNGRFGHPEQDRAISLREAALLQSFPMNYKFVKDKADLAVRSISRHIGNAVPPRLGEVIGESIKIHLNNFQNGEKKIKK